MIRKAEVSDLKTVTDLAVLLWPENEKEPLAKELALLLSDENALLVLAFAGQTPIGFAQAQLRHDYVEGCDSSPVGYLEGIFVKSGFRKAGFARQMLALCESWARKKGCTEFASDCEADNTDSAAFHAQCGFNEANRIICFTKKL